MSDNERDALAAVIHENFNECRGRNGVSPTALADVILAAGFQRSEMPEWEYGISSGHGSVNYVGSRAFVEDRIKSFEKANAPLGGGEHIVRRRKVGLWSPVEQFNV